MRPPNLVSQHTSRIQHAHTALQLPSLHALFCQLSHPLSSQPSVRMRPPLICSQHMEHVYSTHHVNSTQHSHCTQRICSSISPIRTLSRRSAHALPLVFSRDLTSASGYLAKITVPAPSVTLRLPRYPHLFRIFDFLVIPTVPLVTLQKSHGMARAFASCPRGSG